MGGEELYFFTISISDGTISNFYYTTDLFVGNLTVYFIKFVDENIAFVTYENDNGVYSLYYDFSTNEVLNYSNGGDISWFSSSQIIDNDQTVIIGGTNGLPQTIKLRIDAIYYYPTYFYTDDEESVTEITDPLVMALTSTTFTANDLITFNVTAESAALVDLSATYPSMTSYYIGYSTVNPNDDDETLRVDIGFIGDASPITHVCYGDVAGNVTYQPRFYYFEVVGGYDDYSAWMYFNYSNGVFTFNGTVEGTYVLSVVVVYDYGSFGFYKNVIIEVAAPSGGSGDNYCLNLESKGSCVILAIFIALICATVAVAAVVGVVYILKKKASLKANHSKIEETEGPRKDIEQEGAKKDIEPEEIAFSKI